MNRNVRWLLGGGGLAIALAAIIATGFIVDRDLKIDDLPRSEREPASDRGAFISAANLNSKTKLPASEIEKRSGIPSARSRAVVIDTAQLRRAHGKELNIRLELFPDVAPLFTLKVISGFDVNEGMHSGFAEDDPNSRANLTTINGMLSGFVEYRGKKYRIVADPGAGVHYIVEEK